VKTVLITGANKGIGHEVARQLAAKGFHVLVGARNSKAGRKAAEEIADGGSKATFLEIDVADNDSVTSAAREFSNIANHLDRISLVNSCGIVKRFRGDPPSPKATADRSGGPGHYHVFQSRSEPVESR